MPTNLPPEYYPIEARYRAAESIAEKIACIEEMLSVIPKHKGTDKLRADLRRKLSKMRSDPGTRKTGSRQVSPYQIDREGAGQVAVIGPPNVGKSSLVRALTNADPDVADYPFTTQIPTPGMMPYENIQIQLIDTPPLSVEFDEPQLRDLIRRADLILLVVDLQGATIQQLEDSLALLEHHRILPLALRDRYPDSAQIVFKPLLGLVNKTDDESYDEDFEVLCELLGGDTCPLLPVSAATGRYFDQLKQSVFERLNVVRIYSKPPGKEVNFDAPFTMRQGGTVVQFAGKVHNDFVENLRSARVWGGSVTHDGQMVGRDHRLHDGDVVELRV